MNAYLGNDNQVLADELARKLRSIHPFSKWTALVFNFDQDNNNLPHFHGLVNQGHWFRGLKSRYNIAIAREPEGFMSNMDGVPYN